MPIQIAHSPQELQAPSCNGRCSTLTGAEEPQLFGKKSPPTILPKGDTVQRYHAGHLHVLKHPTGRSVTAPNSHFRVSPCCHTHQLRAAHITGALVFLPGLFGRARYCPIPPAFRPAHRHHQQTWLAKAPPTNAAPEETGALCKPQTSKTAARRQHTEAGATFLGFFFYFFFFFYSFPSFATTHTLY